MVRSSSQVLRRALERQCLGRGLARDAARRFALRAVADLGEAEADALASLEEREEARLEAADDSDDEGEGKDDGGGGGGEGKEEGKAGDEGKAADAAGEEGEAAALAAATERLFERFFAFFERTCAAEERALNGPDFW